MTAFFATPDETCAWLDVEVARLRLGAIEHQLTEGSVRYFVWPIDAPPVPDDAFGVMVHVPTIHGDTLTMGETGWKASAFSDPIALVGRRLSQHLARSLRRIATVPLCALSYDRSVRSAKPRAWATDDAVNAGLALRQWRDGAVTFEPCGLHRAFIPVGGM